MKNVRKYWMVMLLGGLLMASLVGVAGAGPRHGSLAREAKTMERALDLRGKQQSHGSQVAGIESQANVSKAPYREDNMVLQHKAEWLERQNQGNLPSPKALQTRAVTRRITVPAGHFSPADHNVNWTNGGYYLKSEKDASLAIFRAPVVFPTGQAVVVESVTLYVHDNNGTYDICANLDVSDPTTGLEAQMAAVCSSGAAMGARHFTDGTIANNPVKHGKGIYLELYFADDTSLLGYAVRIQYHHGTT